MANGFRAPRIVGQGQIQRPTVLDQSAIGDFTEEWKNQRAKYEASMKKKFKFYDEDGTPS